MYFIFWNNNTLKYSLLGKLLLFKYIVYNSKYNTYMYIKILKIALHDWHVMVLRGLTKFLHSPQYIKVIHYITKPQWFIDKHLCCFTRSHYHLLTDELSYLTGWQQHHGGFLQYSPGRSHLCPVFITLQILQTKVNRKCTEEVYKYEFI